MSVDAPSRVKASTTALKIIVFAEEDILEHIDVAEGLFCQTRITRDIVKGHLDEKTA